jgi:hypothetical protein
MPTRKETHEKNDLSAGEVLKGSLMRGLKLLKDGKT